jgi:hypothetical protein
MTGPSDINKGKIKEKKNDVFWCQGEGAERE